MNLIEGLQEELTRCKELLKAYDEIGARGHFAKIMITRQIENAEKEMADMDTIGMIVSYNELKGCN